MTPSPYKIFCIGVIWFIYTIITFISFIKFKAKLFINYIYLSYISFIYSSEKDYFLYINKSKSIKYPTNIGIILNKFFINEQAIVSALCQFIKWIILTNKIKYLTIYDAFNLVNIQTLINEINEKMNNNESLNDNIKIHFSYKNSKNGKIVENNIEILKKSKKSSLVDINLFISYISFKEANEDLINKIVKEKKTKIYGNYPETYKWFDNSIKNDTKNKSDKDSGNDKKKKEFQKYLTRKNEESLPELIITFGKNKYLFYEDICLYGFPFTLLENTEIININHKQFDQIDILDFFDIFSKNSKIIKRFGA